MKSDMNLKVGCNVVGNWETLETVMSRPQWQCMVSIEWSVFVMRTSVGSAGCVGARLGAATGTLTTGLVGPIPYGCRMVSITGVITAGGRRCGVLQIWLFSGYVNEWTERYKCSRGLWGRKCRLRRWGYSMGFGCPMKVSTNRVLCEQSACRWARISEKRKQGGQHAGHHLQILFADPVPIDKPIVHTARDLSTLSSGTQNHGGSLQRRNRHFDPTNHVNTCIVPFIHSHTPENSHICKIATSPATRRYNTSYRTIDTHTELGQPRPVVRVPVAAPSLAPTQLRCLRRFSSRKRTIQLTPYTVCGRLITVFQGFSVTYYITSYFLDSYRTSSRFQSSSLHSCILVSAFHRRRGVALREGGTWVSGLGGCGGCLVLFGVVRVVQWLGSS